MDEGRGTEVVTMDRFSEANRCNWNDRAEIHAADRTGFYRLDQLRAGGDLLTEIEGALLADVSGKHVLHLQCHIGSDTLSIARRGALVTGLDFSSTALGVARRLAAETRLCATFIEGDVLRTRELVDGHFDIVFASWGAINWIADIAAWMSVAASMLRPGGSLILVEGHPCFTQLEESDGQLVHAYPFRTPVEGPCGEADPFTYTGDPTPIENAMCYGWDHPLSDIIMGAIGAGLVIRSVAEHDRVAWRQIPSMVPAGPGLYRLPDGMLGPPLSFSLVATRPADFPSAAPSDRNDGQRNPCFS